MFPLVKASMVTPATATPWAVQQRQGLFYFWRATQSGQGKDNSPAVANMFALKTFPMHMSI